AGWAKALFGNSMVNMDGSEHAALRRIISRRFTPRLLAGVEENVGRLAGRLVDELIAERPRDFVPSAASRLPLEVICDLMGIPKAYRARISQQIDQASEHVGVERRGRARIRIPGRGLASLARMQWGMGRLAAERRRRPGDDLVSALVCADIDGEA
ncbi:cytochrome P450, partial [Streptomyces sp. SID7982]|nr:cytochrome P450 [Streptomyces sp. SID7982]